MLTLHPITTADDKYPFVESLFLSSFPVEERRDTDAQRKNIDSNPSFTLHLAEDNDQPIGFLTIWDLGEFSYCEHFATDSSFRNKGYGGMILDRLLSQLNHPLVLEVELPDNDLARRRIGFYQRHGLTLMADHPYTQPPYRPGGSPLPLRLMVANPGETALDLNAVTAAIHSHVYGINR